MGPGDRRERTPVAGHAGGSAEQGCGPLPGSGLPNRYGPDRAFDYLTDLFQRGNQWEGALAASELFGLGEIETSPEAARDQT
jgi:hypothetical protein